VETRITNILNRLGLGSRTQFGRWMSGLTGSASAGLGQP